VIIITSLKGISFLCEIPSSILFIL
jgi:hypothetical protein